MANLLMNDLELMGIDLESIDADDAVQLYSTTDDYCEELNEATWIAAVYNENMQFVLITQGTLYDEIAQRETGKEVEVGRLFIDDNKAEMLVDALFHAYPDLVRERVYAEDFSENEEDDEDIANIDELIGDLRREIHRLEEKKKEQKQLRKNPASSDVAIDTYQKLKKFSSTLKKEEVEPQVIKRKNTLLFVSGFKENKLIKLTEANLNDIISQNTQKLPSRKITKSILIDKNLAKALAKEVNNVFN